MLSWDEFHQEESPAPAAKTAASKPAEVKQVEEQPTPEVAAPAPEPKFESGVESGDEQANASALQ